MDRRQRKTQRAIYDAFEELLSERHYRSITVAQIIERADIGRSTFYAHFATKDELLAQLCDDLFAHVFDGVGATSHTHDDLHTLTLEGVLAHLLYHVRDSHRGVCAKLLAEGEPQVTAFFGKRLEAYFAPRLPERCSWVPRELLLALLVSGFCQAVSWWYSTGFEATPERLAHWYARTMGWQTPTSMTAAPADAAPEIPCQPEGELA